MIQFHLGVFAEGGAMLCYSLDVNSQRKVHLHSRDADLEIDFKIMHITFLESKVEMLQSLSPPVHWRVQDTDFLMYIDKMYMCKFLSNPAPSMGKDCPLSRRKVMKDILYS